MSQHQVAEKLGRSRTWVGKVEQCERRLEVIELRDMCGLYGLDPLEVFAMVAAEKRPL